MEAKSEKPIILVTGSAGLIGTKVVKAFSSNFEVVGLDLKRPEKIIAGTDFIECDLTKNESVIRALDTVRDKHSDRLASVIHLAAYYLSVFRAVSVLRCPRRLSWSSFFSRCLEPFPFCAISNNLLTYS